MKVKVAEFRNAINHLERLTFTDYHACVDAKERAYWAQVAARIRDELAALECSRAKPEDLSRKARALEATAERLAALA